jgi:hypothetical protein
MFEFSVYFRFAIFFSLFQKCSQLDRMSEEAPTLEDVLLKWATDAGVPFKATELKEELLQQGIGNHQTLKDLAESSGWQRTLDKLSGVLVAKLEKWFFDSFPERKLFRLTNCPISHWLAKQSAAPAS